MEEKDVTSITVSRETQKELNLIKVTGGFKTIEDVILMLIKSHKGV